MSLIDVYTRRILGYVFRPSIEQHDVRWLFRQVIVQNREVATTIRNDNGSQFIAQSGREYLKAIKVNHEFTRISTPEENAYIEAFHSILERELTARYEFDSFFHAEMKIAQYRFTCNNIRKHGAIGLKTPQQAWNEYFGAFPTDRQPSAVEPEGLSRLADPKSATTFDLNKSGGSASFGYLLANENIRNYICKNSQTVSQFYSN